MNIWVTGDTHGDIGRFSSNIFHEQKDMSKENDFVIILGDFGLLWDYTGESSREKYWLDWLENKPFTTLFIPGNHENYDRLDELPTEEWHGGKVSFVRPSVIYLHRGQVFDINGKKIFAFGGASSHDISDGILDPEDPDFKAKRRELDLNPFSLYRINHWSWWERELPSEEEMAEGIENLKKHNNKVDFIFTHSPYTSILKFMDGGAGLYNSDILTDYLQQIKETVDYKAWLFGHMHVCQSFNWDKAHCLYEQIIQIA